MDPGDKHRDDICRSVIPSYPWLSYRGLLALGEGRRSPVSSEHQTLEHGEGGIPGTSPGMTTLDLFHGAAQARPCFDVARHWGGDA